MSNNNKQNEAERGKRPVVLTDVYGTTAPKAARFGVGARVGDAKFGQGTQAAPQVEEATNARRNAPLGHAEYADRNRK
jgi:hypothetical protein